MFRIPGTQVAFGFQSGQAQGQPSRVFVVSTANQAWDFWRVGCKIRSYNVGF